MVKNTCLHVVCHQFNTQIASRVRIGIEWNWTIFCENSTFSQIRIQVILCKWWRNGLGRLVWLSATGDQTWFGFWTRTKYVYLSKFDKRICSRSFCSWKPFQIRHCIIKPYTDDPMPRYWSGRSRENSNLFYQPRMFLFRRWWSCQKTVVSANLISSHIHAQLMVIIKGILHHFSNSTLYNTQAENVSLTISFPITNSFLKRYLVPLYISPISCVVEW